MKKLVAGLIALAFVGVATVFLLRLEPRQEVSTSSGAALSHPPVSVPAHDAQPEALRPDTRVAQRSATRPRFKTDDEALAAVLASPVQDDIYFGFDAATMEQAERASKRWRLEGR